MQHPTLQQQSPGTKQGWIRGSLEESAGVHGRFVHEVKVGTCVCVCVFGCVSVCDMCVCMTSCSPRALDMFVPSLPNRQWMDAYVNAGDTACHWDCVQRSYQWHGKRGPIIPLYLPGSLTGAKISKSRALCGVQIRFCQSLSGSCAVMFSCGCARACQLHYQFLFAFNDNLSQGQNFQCLLML